MTEPYQLFLLIAVAVAIPFAIYWGGVWYGKTHNGPLP